MMVQLGKRFSPVIVLKSGPGISSIRSILTITFTPTWNNANDISLYQIRYFGAYPIDVPEKLFTWDENKKITFLGTVNFAGGGTYKIDSNGDAVLKTIDVDSITVSGNVTGDTATTNFFGNSFLIGDEGENEGFMVSGNAWGLHHPSTSQGGYDAVEIKIDDPFQIRYGSTKIFEIDTSGNIVVVGTVDGVDIAALKTDVDGFPDELKNLLTAEIQQLENIDTVTISNTQWGYLGELDQSLTTTSAPTFAGATFTAFPTTPASAPATDYEVANKKYVDDSIAGGGISNAYAYMTDGANTASSSGSDTFRFRSANSILSVLVTDNDATYGDNALFTVNQANIDHNSISNTHNLTTDIDHNSLTNTHNLTTDIDHNSLTNYVAAEHLSLPNTIVNVLSDHNKANHDSLGLDHGSLSGLSGDHHTQYLLIDGTRVMTGLLEIDSTAGVKFKNSGDAGDRAILLYYTSEPEWRNCMMVDNANDIVSITNRAPNGIVQIRANTATGGSGGEVTVASFTDTGVTLKSGTEVNEFSTDGTLSGNSDSAVPTEKAVKTYVDGFNFFDDAPSGTQVVKWVYLDPRMHSNTVAVGSATWYAPGYHQMTNQSQYSDGQYFYAAGYIEIPVGWKAKITAWRGASYQSWTDPTNTVYWLELVIYAVTLNHSTNTRNSTTIKTLSDPFSVPSGGNGIYGGFNDTDFTEAWFYTYDDNTSATLNEIMLRYKVKEVGNPSDNLYLYSHAVRIVFEKI